MMAQPVAQPARGLTQQLRHFGQCIELLGGRRRHAATPKIFLSPLGQADSAERPRSLISSVVSERQKAEQTAIKLHS
jgi:hypothetical protein